MKRSVRLLALAWQLDVAAIAAPRRTAQRLTRARDQLAHVVRRAWALDPARARELDAIEEAARNLLAAATTTEGVTP